MNIEKYWYDSRYDYVDFIKRFPSKGWLFPCYNCELITGKKKVLTRLNFHKGSDQNIFDRIKTLKKMVSVLLRNKNLPPTKVVEITNLVGCEAIKP